MSVRRNSTICQAYFFLSKLPYSSSELLHRSPASEGRHILHWPRSFRSILDRDWGRRRRTANTAIWPKNGPGLSFCCLVIHISEADLAGDSKELFVNRQLFERPSLVEVKMNESFKNNQCIRSRSFWKKLGFAKCLGEVWRDLQDDPHWKYEQLSPVQLLEKSELHTYPTDNDELARANWFWTRRPRLLPVASCIVWIIVALGLPFWLFIVPSIGVPVLMIAAVIVDVEIVRSVRWRRQYEISIDRLIRTSTNGRDTFGVDVFA
jgi:hypothetical protein